MWRVMETRHLQQLRR